MENNTGWTIEQIARAYEEEEGVEVEWDDENMDTLPHDVAVWWQSWQSREGYKLGEVTYH